MFTASQIAAALGLKRQAAQWHLRRVTVSTTGIVRGKEAAFYDPAQLPAPLVAMLETARQKGRYRSLESLLTSPPRRVDDLPALDLVAPEEIEHAIKLRDALQPFLVNQHAPGVPAGEWKQNGVEAYRRVFGHTISERHWFNLFKLALDRDGGAESWNNLQLYLRKNPRLKKDTGEAESAQTIAPVITPACFENLGALLAQLHNPLDPTTEERKAVWAICFQEYATLVSAGASEKSAARQLRDYLFEQAKFLPRNRNALRMQFERNLAKWQPDNPHSLNDGRKGNGNVADYPSQDIRRVRHSAVLKNGGRIDAAWREAYKQLSEDTRARHPCSVKCPDAFARRVNRIKVDALLARLQGKRTLRHLIGGVKRDATGIPSMARWSVDDWTSNIEVAFTNRDGTTSLIQPQIITVMDFASRKWVGWAMSNDKAPTAELVCAAILDGFKRHDVPQKLCLENGFVFGKSLNVNGQVDDQGRSVVAGLAQYGCTVHHFGKMSPTSKGELEKSFDLVQRLMERHPGYGGRSQMLDASEDFKREQRLIRSGKVNAADHRYAFPAFARVIGDMVNEYNATPQHGHLAGLSPDEAFEALKAPGQQPVKFDNQLYWMLANERYRVRVTAGGVVKSDGGALRHYGRKLEVRGGELPQHTGEELWALVDRQDASMVTFMSLDHTKTFTVATCQQPSADESKIVTGAGVLAAELQKIGQHLRAVSDELSDLKGEFGNPRKDLLAKYRAEAAALPGVTDTVTRKVILNNRIQNSAEQMETQRAAIITKRQQNTANKTKARRQNIPPELVDDDDQSRRALELLGDMQPVSRVADGQPQTTP